jgi:predicted ester cyclase
LGRAESGVPQQGDTTGGASVSERNKASVRRLVEEVLNGGRMDVIDALYAPALAAEAKAWIAPFRASFPDVHMEVVELIAEGDAVVGRFTCSGTHLGEWLGYAPTGRRFEAVAEVSIYRFRDGRIVESWGLEDNLGRLEQLGLR